jgi:hypothetical protein
MRIPRLDYDPASALAFYEESLSAMGALCERTWHDRLGVLAEARPAKLWNEDGALYEQELVFASADVSVARDARREVFPGCPLTFRLFELLRPVPLTLEKVVLRPAPQHHALDQTVLEKLWRNQYPATRRWRPTTDLKPAFHFSLVAMVRCEIQAIDQHWSLQRIAIALPGGEADDLLAREVPLLEVDLNSETQIDWPAVKPTQWWPVLRREIELEMGRDVEAMKARQLHYLQRELERLDDYFAHYEQELTERTSRGGAASTVKAGERLAAARAEHSRRRLDQVARHEICVQSHLDALLLVGEPCWRASVEVEAQRAAQTLVATFVPRTRHWFREHPPA